MYASKFRLAGVVIVISLMLSAAAGSTQYTVSSPNPTERDVHLSPHEAWEIAGLQNVVFLDIRDATAFAAEHIMGALSVPLSTIICGSCLTDELAGYEESTIIVYGIDDDQAQYAADRLDSYAHSIHVLEGGFVAWKNNGYSVDTATSTRGEKATGCVSLATAGVQPTDIKTLTANHAPPDQWDWRSATYQNITGNWMTPVKDQGPCGSCWGFAAMGALEAVINIRAQDPDIDFDLSEQYLLSCPIASGGCSGWNAFWAFSYIKQSGGIITENCFRYSANDNVPCEDKCEDWQQNRVPITKYGSIRRPSTEELQAALVNHGPLVTEMAVFGDFGSYEGGIYEHPGEESTSDINHQVVIVGYNDEQQYWIVKNSWGPEWGENGYFKIAYGDCMIEHYLIYVDFSPVIARMNGPYYQTSGESIAFDASASIGLLAPIVSYLWDFGDGMTATGPLSTHVYASEGVYTVRLTLNDEQGTQGTIKSKAYIDNTAPTVYISSPEQYRFYFFGEEKRNLMFSTIIIGDITVAASASDNISGLERVEYYLDGQLIMTTTDQSFEWYWNDADIGAHRLMIRAYDRAGNEGITQLRVWTWI